MTTPVTPPVAVQEHSWLPKASCDTSCIRVDAVHVSRPVVVILRTTVRLIMTMLLLPALPLLAVPLPGKSRIQRMYCRLMLRCLGVRITVSGGPMAPPISSYSCSVRRTKSRPSASVSTRPSSIAQ